MELKPISPHSSLSYFSILTKFKKTNIGLKYPKQNKSYKHEYEKVNFIFQRFIPLENNKNKFPMLF